ncbi:hypothetical protein [Anaeroselena agilis]|uniref:Uncharacterized protein n=1 Tax=Anaeroselena agilis TaxID=3063788 RepID=A0ABU3P188_9FIRM|nr:hypothetical protein [Selenomonadales bacterium 4137-cl]
MKEILVFGEGIEQHFERIGIKPKITWSGHGWRPDDNLSVCQMSDEEFELLCADPEENWDNSESGWRYSESSNMVEPIGRFTINGRYLKAWVVEEADTYGRKWDFVLRYFCDAIGASQPRNVTALAAHLAKINDMTLGQFMERYQGRRTA